MDRGSRAAVPRAGKALPWKRRRRRQLEPSGGRGPVPAVRGVVAGAGTGGGPHIAGPLPLDPHLPRGQPGEGIEPVRRRPPGRSPASGNQAAGRGPARGAAHRAGVAWPAVGLARQQDNGRHQAPRHGHDRAITRRNRTLRRPSWPASSCARSRQPLASLDPAERTIGSKASRPRKGMARNTITPVAQTITGHPSGGEAAVREVSGFDGVTFLGPPATCRLDPDRTPP